MNNVTLRWADYPEGATLVEDVRINPYIELSHFILPQLIDTNDQSQTGFAARP